MRMIARTAASVILGLAAAGGVWAWNTASVPAAQPKPVAKAYAYTPPRAPKVAAPKPKKVESAYLDADYVVKRVLPIDGPMKEGDWYWDERDVPKGPGAIVITVDLAARTMSVFRDGYEIGATVVALGADEKPTPLGIFPITQKDADHVSNIYDGAPMPYMLRMTNDGVSIHGSKIGTDEVTYVTHGCVGVPLPFARKLFGVTKLGDKVIVTRGEMLDVGKAIKAA